MQKTLDKIEFVDVLDNDGNLTGEIKDKKQVFKDKQFCRAVHLWIINPKTRKILIQKRTEEKENHPNEWDLSCGGHVKSGESSKDAIIRETKEELGIDISKDKFIKAFEIKHDGNRKYFFDVYVLERDVDMTEIVLQKEEVSEVQYFSINELENMYSLNLNFVKQDYFFRIIELLKNVNN